jgi:hypothetical protein
MQSKLLITLISLAVITTSAVSAGEPALPSDKIARAAELTKLRSSIFSTCNSLQHQNSPEEANQWKMLRKMYEAAGIADRLLKLKKLSKSDFLEEESRAANPETTIEVLSNGTLIVSNGIFSQLETVPDDPGYKLQLEYYRALYWWFDFSQVKPIPPEPDFSNVSFFEDGAFTGSAAYPILQDAMRDINNGYFDNAQKRLDFLLNNKFVRQRMPDIIKKVQKEFSRLNEARKLN